LEPEVGVLRLAGKRHHERAPDPLEGLLGLFLGVVKVKLVCDAAEVAVVVVLVIAEPTS